MEDLDIRRARPDETDRIRELTREAMRETPEWVPDAPDEDLRDVAGHYLDVEGCEFLVGVVQGGDGDAIVGTGAYVPVEGWMADQFDSVAASAELTRMRVAPEFQGQGIGSAMYRELESRARDDGYREFVLNTGTENETARGFYESHGFDCVRELTVEFDGISLDLALYHKLLT